MNIRLSFSYARKAALFIVLVAQCHGTISVQSLSGYLRRYPQSILHSLLPLLSPPPSNNTSSVSSVTSAPSVLSAQRQPNYPLSILNSHPLRVLCPLCALCAVRAAAVYIIHIATAAGSSMKECRRQNFVLLNLRLPFEFEAVFLDVTSSFGVIIITTPTNLGCTSTCYARTGCYYL